MKANGVQLDLSAGRVFGFDTHSHSKDYTNKRFVNDEGQLDASYLYFRLAAPADQRGLLASMPLHTAGGPDCRGVAIVARWIRSYDKTMTPAALDAFVPPEACTPDTALNAGTFSWTPEDFTTLPGQGYQPRRADWADPTTGMSEVYRNLRIDSGLAALLAKEYPVDFWQAKPECQFPEVTLPPAEQRPWMLTRDGTPKQPFGQLYKVTPGAWFFTTTCSKCHGNQADGKGELAGDFSAAGVQVADLADGLFGKGGRNLELFDQPEGHGGRINLAPNYLVWMAMEGTRINVPPQLEKYLGKHRAQMLKQIKDRCQRQIKTSPMASSSRFNEHDLFRELCLYGNAPVDTPEIQFDPNTDLPINPAAQDAWLNRGAYNAGFAIFTYLRQAATSGRWLVHQTECEKEYPKR